MGSDGPRAGFEAVPFLSDELQPQGLKPSHFGAVCGTTEVVPLLQGESAFRGLKAPAPSARGKGAEQHKRKARG